MTRAAWINGVVCAGDAPAVSAFDQGLRGLGVFETLRSVDGTLPTLAAHVLRMRWCGLHLGIDTGADVAAWHAVAAALLDRTGLRDAVLRLFCTRGDGRGLTRGMTVEPVPDTLEPLRRRGARVGVSPFRRHVDDPTAGLKLMSYAFCVLAREEALARGLDEAVLLSPDGHVQEGAFSNVFCLRDGVVYTPTLNGYLLPGVTRALVLRALRARGYRCREVTLGPEQFASADAIWLTSGVWEVMPVVAWCGRAVPGQDHGLAVHQALRADLARELRPPGAATV